MSDAELPPGWVWATLGTLADSVKNGIYVSRPGIVPNGTPILRISAVRPMRLNASDVRYTGLSPEEVDSKDGLVRPGDLLFTRYNGNPDLVGACARFPDSPAVAYPDKLIRVRVSPNKVDGRFLCYAWAWVNTQRQLKQHVKTTAGQAGISGASLKSIILPLAPLAEQHRIVEALEDHLSRLSAVNLMLDSIENRIRSLKKSVLIELVPENPPESWEVTTVAQAGTVDLGRQRHPDWHTGPLMKPYLRVANVFEDHIDTSDIKEMDFSGVFDRYRLKPGDVLLNEGQTPDLVGRPAIYRGDPPDVAFQKSLLRFRPRSGVLPEWALLVFRRHLHAKRFKREVRITTNITHLPAVRFKPIEFPIPPLDEQKRLIELARERLDGADRLAAAIARARVRSDHLWGVLLSCAFAGKLVSPVGMREITPALVTQNQTPPEIQRGKLGDSGHAACIVASSPPSPSHDLSASNVTANVVQQEFTL